MLENKQLADIGYEYVINCLEPASPFGAEAVRRVKPFKERGALMDEFKNIELVYGCLLKERGAFDGVLRLFMQLKDIRRSITRSRETTLSDVELFEVKRFLIILEALDAECKNLPVLNELENIRIAALTPALDIIDPDGLRAQTFRLSDSCSEALSTIRRDRKAVDAALRALDAGRGAEADRLTAERTLLAAKEENEEQRLRTEMTRRLSAYADEIERVIEAVSRLDLALAKAKLMLERGCCIPEISENPPDAADGAIAFEKMVNPQTQAHLAARGLEFTPVSITLIIGSTVITGANMGGKSVAVKTAALNTLLAVSGIPVFAEKARLPLVSDIHLLSEDMEDSAGGLSSFGGEMVRFNAILAASSKQSGSLVLLDEFARGTNPHEGSKLVRAAVKYFNDRRIAYALVTTHFDDVACLAPAHYQVMGFKNADEAALSAALSAGGGDKRELLARFMDYGLFKAETNLNPPRDALKICRALKISNDFMSYIDEPR